ncbi:hypothetical protein ACIBG5_26025 [Kribbella sp. NPDC050241]
MRMSARRYTKYAYGLYDAGDDFAFDSGPSSGSDSDLGDSAASGNNW